MKVLPQSVCDRVERLCRVHDQKTAAAIVGISEKAVTKLKMRGWKAADPGRYRRPRPSDFAIQSRHMNQVELARHYRTGCDQIGRWRREVRG